MQDGVRTRDLRLLKQAALTTAPGPANSNYDRFRGPFVNRYKRIVSMKKTRICNITFEFS